MPFDDDLAERLRAALAAAGAAADERRMFGGLAFLVGGHMAVVAASDGGLMARVDPAQAEALLAQDGVRPMEMRGREMSGWLRVANAAVADDGALEAWVARGLGVVRALPPKG